MYIEFDKIDDGARIWIYQCSRWLSEKEQQEIRSLGRDFVGRWTAHNKDLLASFDISHGRFLIFAVDEKNSSASGCSIDKSVHFLRAIDEKYQIDPFCRTELAFIRDGELQTVNLDKILQSSGESLIGEEEIVFNNLVETVGEWRKSWEIPFKHSWIASRMKKVQI